MRLRATAIGLAALVFLVGCPSEGSTRVPVPRIEPTPNARQAAPGLIDERQPVEPAPTVVTTLTTDDERTRTAQGMNAFAADLWQRVRSRDGNLAVSPASISLALGMAYGGAHGETAAQMRTALHLALVDDRVHAANGDLLALWNAQGKPYEMHVANRVFADGQFPIAAGYVALTRDRYGAPLETLDLRGAPDASAGRINAWVAGQTRGRIRDIVSADLLRQDPRAVLVNAIYFKGRWVTPFERDATHDQDFTLASGQRVRAPMMHATEHFGYAAVEDGAKVLQMRYVGNEIEMIVALPREHNGLPALERSVNATTVDRWVAGMSGHEVIVELPRFRIEAASPLLLGADLQALGMPLAFTNDADFSAMSADERVKISEVVHKAFVEVNEEGTEAAAATAVLAVTAGAPPPAPTEPLRFVADHPFLFFIRDVRSGAILFWGRVASPRSA